MNTRVSSDLAKLLREKSFEGFCTHYYSNDGKLYPRVLSSGDEPVDFEPDDFYENFNTIVRYKVGNSYEQVNSAPTIAEVVMWLYEKHGIWIACETSKLGKFNYRLSKKESSKLETLPFTFEVVNAGYDYNSPTEAYEAAIKYVLTKLI